MSLPGAFLSLDVAFRDLLKLDYNLTGTSAASNPKAIHYNSEHIQLSSPLSEKTVHFQDKISSKIYSLLEDSTNR